MFERIGKLVAAHPWRVIGVWLVAAIAIASVSPSLADQVNPDQASFLPDEKESARARALAKRSFPAQSGSSAIVVFSAADGEAITPAQSRRIGGIADRLAEAPIDPVLGLSTGPDQVSPEREVQLARIAFAGDARDEPVQEAVRDVRAQLDRLVEGSGLRYGVTGDAAIVLDSQEAFADAEVVVGIATITLIIGLLLAIFRSPAAALLPILSVGLVFATATSLIALLAETLGFEIGPELTSLLIVVLFGIGTDYILFFLFRYRERLRAGDESRRAVSFAVTRVGEAIASAALVVMAAFTVLLLTRLGSFETMAPGLVIAVGVMLLAALTLVPAIVALVGPRVFWPSRRWQSQPQGTISKRVGEAVARRPARTGLASGGLLAALAVGVFFYTPDYDTIEQLPSDTEAAEAFRELRSGFPAGALNPTYVYVRDEGGVQARELAALRSRLAGAEGVASVSEPLPGEAGAAAQLTVVLERNPFSNEALDDVEGPIRSAAHAAEPSGGGVLVGGQTSAFVDVREVVGRDLSVVFPVAALAIGLILALLLRSLVAPLYLLAAVVLGFTATLGTSVAVFQGLAGEFGLGFSLPIILYLFVVAIGTDYNILMITRLREEVLEGHAPRRSADLSVEHAGPTIAAAGTILAGTFASLILTRVGPLVEMGFAVSLGVAISAFVMATVLVPSLSALIGRRVWWPGHRAEAPGGGGADPSGTGVATDPSSGDGASPRRRERPRGSPPSRSTSAAGRSDAPPRRG